MRAQVHDMLESGRAASAMASVSCNGKTEQSMRAFGAEDVLSGRVSSHIPRERSTQVNGETIKLMARVPTHIPMVRSMKVSGI